MARKPTGRPAGRPKKPTGPPAPPPIRPGCEGLNHPAVIDWELVDQYLESGASGVQIAAKLNLWHETLYDCCVRDHKENWTEYSHRKKIGGDADLHRLQMVSARRGNTQILLRLGELRLGQGKIEEKLPPHEEMLEMRHRLMMLEAENAKLKEGRNADKPQAEQELCGSDSSV